MLLVAGYYEKWTHTHTHRDIHTHSHSLCQYMLLTTPTSLSFLKERSLRTNNSSSHIILLLHSLLLLFLPITLPFPIFHISSTFQPYCHCSLPSRAPLDLSSQCRIDLHELSPAISPYLLIPTLSISPSQDCFHFCTDTQSFFRSAPIACSGTVFPLQLFLNLFFCFTISENWM